MELDRLGRVYRPLLLSRTHLRNMNKAVLMDSYVNESPEIGHVRHDSRKLHPRLQIIYFMNILGKAELLRGLARVTPRLLQLIQNVIYGRKPEISADILRSVNLLYKLLIADQFFFRHTKVRSHLRDNVVALRMHGRIVQRILRIMDSEEARALLESLGTKLRNLPQLSPGSESAVRSPVCHNVRRQGRPDSRHIPEQIRTCSVQVHAHAVHADDYSVVQLFLQKILVHVMLVLPHSKGLRINLHQLRQRIHQTAADGHGPAHGHILVRELFTGDFRC